MLLECNPGYKRGRALWLGQATSSRSMGCPKLYNNRVNGIPKSSLGFVLVQGLPV